MASTISKSSQAAREGARSNTGEFGNQVKSEATDVVLDNPYQDAPCAECGDETKRSSGLCKRCDPSSKYNKRRSDSGETKSGRSRSTTPANPAYDTDTQPLDLDEISQCEFEFVPKYQSGSLVEGEFRQCKNAVVAPATSCHRHGGATGTSLGRSVAKAEAEAGRGECYPIRDEHWEESDQRVEVARGQLMEIMETDSEDLNELMSRWIVEGRESSTARMSISNQALIAGQYMHRARQEGMERDEAMEWALGRLNEPHMTKNVWAGHGREPVEGAEPVGVIWFKPSSRYTDKQRDDETDEEYTERVESGKARRVARPKFGGHSQYPLDATDGDDYDAPRSPLDAHRPKAHGDPDAAIGEMRDFADEQGIGVRFTDHQPASGAFAYWRADTSEIVVWNGVADGDRGAVAHSLAHELGHAALGHSTEDAAEHSRPDKESGAEAYAGLMMKRFGIETDDLSAFYITNWQSRSGDKQNAGGLSAFSSACEAYDDYVTAVGTTTEQDG